jgi:hypothetical protein
MADRTIAPAGDVFLIWTAIVASLTAQLILTLLGLGAGIITAGYVARETIAWGGFLWWAASGIFAAALGGMAIAALGDGIDDARKTVLALIAWATAILIVAIVTAIAAGGGASIFSSVSGPVQAMLASLADAKATAATRQAGSLLAVSSVVALLLGAAAQVAGAIYAPETNVKTGRR